MATLPEIKALLDSVEDKYVQKACAFYQREKPEFSLEECRDSAREFWQRLRWEFKGWAEQNLDDLKPGQLETTLSETYKYYEKKNRLQFEEMKMIEDFNRNMKVLSRDIEVLMRNLEDFSVNREERLRNTCVAAWKRMVAAYRSTCNRMATYYKIALRLADQDQDQASRDRITTVYEATRNGMQVVHEAARSDLKVASRAARSEMETAYEAGRNRDGIQAAYEAELNRMKASHKDRLGRLEDHFKDQALG